MSGKREILRRRIAALLAALICGVVLVTIERAPERPLEQQPFPDSAEYASSAHSLAIDKGYFTYVHDESRQPSRYPPGYPMVLAPFASFGSYPRDIQRGAKFWAMAYVIIATMAAWVLGGPLAGVLAAIFIGVSPFAKDSAGLILSDAFTAGLTVLMLPLLRYQTRSGARLAGVASGLAALARVTGIISLIALFSALPRRSWKTVLLFALPSLVGLALLQWIMFGNPLATGYSYWGVSSHLFSISYLTGGPVIHNGLTIFPDKLNGGILGWKSTAGISNLEFYPLLLVGAFWVFSPPFVPLLGLIYAWRQRRTPVGRYTLSVTVLYILVFCLYQFQEGRFLAGPATLLTVLASVWLAELATQQFRRLQSRVNPQIHAQ